MTSPDEHVTSCMTRYGDSEDETPSSERLRHYKLFILVPAKGPLLQRVLQPAYVVSSGTL